MNGGFWPIFNQRLNRPPVCLYSVVEVNWCSRRVVVSILRQFRFVFCDPNPHLLFGFVVVQEMVERNDTGSDEPLHKFPYSSFLLHFCKFYARAEKFRKVRLVSSIFKTFVLSISYFIRFKTHQLLNCYIILESGECLDYHTFWNLKIGSF